MTKLASTVHEQASQDFPRIAHRLRWITIRSGKRTSRPKIDRLYVETILNAQLNSGRMTALEHAEAMEDLAAACKRFGACKNRDSWANPEYYKG